MLISGHRVLVYLCRAEPPSPTIATLDEGCLLAFNLGPVTATRLDTFEQGVLGKSHKAKRPINTAWSQLESRDPSLADLHLCIHFQHRDS